MNLLIYDPSESALEHICDCLQSEIAANRWDGAITTAAVLEWSLAEICKDNYDIAFINISDTASADTISSAFRTRNPDAVIIFTGGTSENLVSLLRYTPADYICDVYDVNRLQSIVYKIYNNKWLNSRYYVITTRNGVERVPHMDVEYFESDNRKVAVHKSHRQISVFYGTINDVQEKLKHDISFVRCHQSFIVNLDNVQSINYKEKCFVMKSGFPVFISRRYYAETKKSIERYIKRRNGE